jgi:predicted pyridoxine 5'-phosphate oxidase superfamily flavin-nucleotide-binding protein
MDITPSSNVAFSPAVKAIQAARGSREGYARMERRGGWRTEITPDLAGFIAATRSFYLASASAEGQPYIQHRGGPPGFLRVLDAETLAFADLSGNRQYITLGNLSENQRVQLFLMDYAQQRRVKIWGEARVVTDDPALLRRWCPTAPLPVPNRRSSSASPPGTRIATSISRSASTPRRCCARSPSATNASRRSKWRSRVCAAGERGAACGQGERGGGLPVTSAVAVGGALPLQATPAKAEGPLQTSTWCRAPRAGTVPEPAFCA